MIDQWFLQELEEKLSKRKRVVVLDPTHSYEFLINLAKEKGFIVLRTDDNAQKEWQRVKDEMLLRFEAETKFENKNVIFYSTRPKAQLSFLFDYCFTHGCIDFTYPVDWLKNRLFEATRLQITLDSEELIAAANQSVGKNLDWWKKILQELEDIIPLETELLPFLSDPKKYFKGKDDVVKRLFEKKIFKLLGQPYTQKPPQTLAKEIVNLLFTQLLNNDVNSELLNVYHKWLDSQLYSESLNNYIRNFKIDDGINIWNVHPKHCFEEIDVRQLKEIAKNLGNNSFVKEKIQKIKKRVESSFAKKYVPDWTKYLITLIEFDTKPLSNCNNLAKVIEFYTNSFHNVDRAIRNFYANFIHDKEIIRPIQEYYESLNCELLQSWFERIDEYKSNQSGFLIGLFKKANPKTAVIVGDGLRYEIAAYVADKLNESIKKETGVMLAEIPSETEHNMSALYMSNGEVVKFKKDREKRLTELSGKTIVYKNLKDISLSEDSEYLVLTYNDIDSIGEKKQLDALELFENFENILLEKIDLLAKKNYKVYLVTDHGFVLTGLLDESDKIETKVNGKAEIHERYIRTLEKQNKQNWIEFEEQYDEFNYVYVAKTHRPFKSVGVYGFSHGGLTPQEVIIPNFIFQTEHKFKGLKITIENKKELNEVVGEHFIIKLKAADSMGDIFSASRKVQVLLFAANKQYSESDIKEMEIGKTITFQFSLGGNNKIKATIIDAQSREQLDEADITKLPARDLDGL